MAVTEQQVKVFMAKRAEGQSKATAAAPERCYLERSRRKPWAIRDREERSVAGRGAQTEWIESLSSRCRLGFVCSVLQAHECRAFPPRFANRKLGPAEALGRFLY